MEIMTRFYNKPAAILTKPLQIGEFSSHANLGFESNARNLRYLIHVEKDFEPLFNLDAGFNNFFAKDPTDCENDLIHLQEWAISERGKFSNDYKRVFRNAEMVCCRGTLTNIAQTPYYSKDPWRMVAVRHEGIIYIHSCGATDGMSFCYPENPLDAHLTYWGHSFQRIMTSRNYDYAMLGGFDDSEIVDCRETYSAVYRSDIIKPNGDKIKLAYSSEIKAVDENNKFVDFKTQDSHNYNGNWLKKSWYWWFQSHFSAVDRVYVGFRSELGIVHNIRVAERSYLRKHAGSRCDVVLNIVTDVLSEVKKRCVDSLEVR
ncbi:hypothetical protein PMAYCL1PPCAC_02001, partial [Pristionchus mayeri]